MHTIGWGQLAPPVSLVLQIQLVILQVLLLHTWKKTLLFVSVAHQGESILTYSICSPLPII
jgi:hypothetical protein